MIGEILRVICFCVYDKLYRQTFQKRSDNPYHRDTERYSGWHMHICGCSAQPLAITISQRERTFNESI